MLREVRGGLVFTLLPLMIAGCGGDPGVSLHPVKGKLTKGGMPLSGVTVNFSPVGTEAGMSSSGMTNANGDFVLVAQTGKAGAVAGMHKVQLTVQAASESGAMSDEARREKMMKERSAALQGSTTGAPSSDPAGGKSELFPKEYQSIDTSPLQYEVKAGANDFDIVIP